jgi:hypothetical protein
VAVVSGHISQKLATAALGRARPGQGIVGRGRGGGGGGAAAGPCRQPRWAATHPFMASRELILTGSDPRCPGPWHCQPFRVQVHGRRHLPSARDRGDARLR